MSLHHALSRLPAAAPNHPAVRRYSRARRNALPREDRVSAVAGRWAHQVLLDAGAAVETLLWCPGERPAGAELAECAGRLAGRCRAFAISPRTLARIHPGRQAPTALSVVRLPTWSPADVLTAQARLLLVADGIEYAGNLGTLVRTADAAGAAGLILTGGAARLTHPKAFVASRGTVLTTPVVEYGAVDAARRDLSRAGFTTYLADPAAHRPYNAIDFTAGRAAVVVGSERAGVSATWRDGADGISIPMHGAADSLNVAASAAVLLFAARAQLDVVAARPAER